MQRGDHRSTRLSNDLRAVLDNAQFRRLELASLLWNTAEQVYLVGLLVFAYSAAGTTGVALAGTLQVTRGRPRDTSPRPAPAGFGSVSSG